MTPQKPTLQRAPQKTKQDASYFKRKADFYNKKVLLAQTSDLVTDESSEEDEPQKGLVAFEDSESDMKTQRVIQSSVVWQLVIITM